MQSRFWLLLLFYGAATSLLQSLPMCNQKNSLDINIILFCLNSSSLQHQESKFVFRYFHCLLVHNISSVMYQYYFLFTEPLNYVGLPIFEGIGVVSGSMLSSNKFTSSLPPPPNCFVAQCKLSPYIQPKISADIYLVEIRYNIFFLQVLPLENKMKTPQDAPKVFTITLVGVTLFHAMFGVLGYIAFGQCTKGSILLNLISINNIETM